MAPENTDKVSECHLEALTDAAATRGAAGVCLTWGLSLIGYYTAYKVGVGGSEVGHQLVQVFLKEKRFPLAAYYKPPQRQTHAGGKN